MSLTNASATPATEPTAAVFGRRAAMYPLNATSRTSTIKGRAPNMPPRTDSPRTAAKTAAGRRRTSRTGRASTTHRPIVWKCPRAGNRNRPSPGHGVVKGSISA
jgi:hypothetical protein